MIAVATRRAASRGIGNITWLVGPAETFDALPASFDLVTIGEAFHRLVPRVVTSLAFRLLRPGGCLATLGTDNRFSGDEPWEIAYRAVRDRWIARSFPDGFGLVLPGGARDQADREAAMRSSRVRRRAGPRLRGDGGVQPRRARSATSRPPRVAPGRRSDPTSTSGSTSCAPRSGRTIRRGPRSTSAGATPSREARLNRRSARRQPRIRDRWDRRARPRQPRRRPDPRRRRPRSACALARRPRGGTSSRPCGRPCSRTRRSGGGRRPRRRYGRPRRRRSAPSRSRR